MISPFGKYGEIVSSILAVMIVAAALLTHMLIIAGTTVVSPDTGFLDNVALVVVAFVFGTRVGMNGAGQIAKAAQTRLDKIGAPPAQGETLTSPAG